MNQTESFLLGGFLDHKAKLQLLGYSWGYMALKPDQYGSVIKEGKVKIDNHLIKLSGKSRESLLG